MISETLTTDGGRQFSSDEFENFVIKFKKEHKTSLSSPIIRWDGGNAAVKVKNLIEKDNDGKHYRCPTAGMISLLKRNSSVDEQKLAFHGNEFYPNQKINAHVEHKILNMKSFLMGQYNKMPNN